MSTPSTRSPTGVPGPLRVVPSLVFDVTRTVGTLTTAAFGPGYVSTQVTLMSNAALGLQRDLGPELFTVLLVLAMSADEERGGLVVDSATAALTAQTGWGRQKCSRLLTQLETAGFLRSEQQRIPNDKGKLTFAYMRTWLTPELYQTTERRLTIATAPPVSGAGASAVGNWNNGPTLSADAFCVSGTSVGAERDNEGVGAGQSADAFPDTEPPRHHHGDEDEDDFHSPGGDEDEQPAARSAVRSANADFAGMRPALPRELRSSAALAYATQPASARPAVRTNVAEVRRMSAYQTEELLRSWRVFGAQHLVRDTPPQVLAEAIAATTDRLDSVANPGAYFRQLLRQASPALRSTTAQPGTPAIPSQPSQVAPPVPSSSTAAHELDAAPPPPPSIPEVLESMSPFERDEVHSLVAADVSAATWLNGRPERLRVGFEQDRLAARLRDRGLLPDSPPSA